MLGYFLVDVYRRSEATEMDPSNSWKRVHFIEGIDSVKRSTVEFLGTLSSAAKCFKPCRQDFYMLRLSDDIYNSTSGF